CTEGTTVVADPWFAYW
nr:immunoglobulin heavy chain junction region [Mus musculus]